MKFGHRDRLFRAICERYNVTSAKLTGPQRDIFKARAVLCWLLRRHGFSYPQIGMFLKRDHTTIINAVKRAQGMIDADANLAAFCAAQIEGDE